MWALYLGTTVDQRLVGRLSRALFQFPCQWSPRQPMCMQRPRSRITKPAKQVQLSKLNGFSISMMEIQTINQHFLPILGSFLHTLRIFLWIEIDDAQNASDIFRIDCQLYIQKIV